MNIYYVILILVTIVSIISLIVFISLNKLKECKEKIIINENDINNCLNKKLDIIKNINNEFKKGENDKDYLKDYLSINEQNINNIEKDIKLNEAKDLLNKLIIDNEKFNTTKVKKYLTELRKIDEKLTSAKELYNKNVLVNNNLIKVFPNSIISKLFNYKVKSYYNNKTDELDNF